MYAYPHALLDKETKNHTSVSYGDVIRSVILQLKSTAKQTMCVTLSKHKQIKP